MGESTSRWAGMAPPRRHWSTTPCWARSHWRAVLSTGQCGQGQPTQENAKSPSLNRAFSLQTWFLPPGAYSLGGRQIPIK